MKKSVAGMIGKILGLRLYKRDSCTCCSSLPLERFFHEENYFSWIDSCNLSRKKNKHTVNPERARERERESNQGP